MERLRLERCPICIILALKCALATLFVAALPGAALTSGLLITLIWTLYAGACLLLL